LSSNRQSRLPRVILPGTAVLILLLASCAHLAPRENAAGPAVVENDIRFSFFAPSAGRVQLAGDWPENNWARGDGSSGESNIGLMQDDDGDGIWEITVRLAPGRYRYLYLVDENRWFVDPGNPDEVAGGPEQICSQIVLFRRAGRLELR
jgi:1,4-alpha-glucan branching enzyme